MRTATDTMNCLRAENLLPLFVAGDLTDERARDLLARHLRSCAPCARRADEYRESQNQLRLFAPPQFSEDFFQDIRQAVMSEIERGSALPVASPLFSSLSLRRTTLALAASLALLLASGALALHLLRQRMPPKSAPPPVADVRPITSPTTPASQRQSASGREESARDAVSPISPAADSNSASPPRLAARPQRTALARATRNQSSQARLSRTFSADFTGPRESVDGAAQAGTTDPPVIRMEIQTADPTIRIIWFASRSTE